MERGLYACSKQVIKVRLRWMIQAALSVGAIFFIEKSGWAGVSEAGFYDILRYFTHEYSIIAEERGEAITFNPVRVGQESFWWDLDTERAAYNSIVSEVDGVKHHYIYLFGGMARRPTINRDGLALYLCHELGHGFATGPWHDDGKSAVEGEADYYATGACLRQVFTEWEPPLDLPRVNSNLAIGAHGNEGVLRQTCREQLDRVLDPVGYEDYCVRALRAVSASQITFFRDIEGVETSLFAIASEQPSEMNLANGFYPSQQCRIETYVRSILQLSRPRCWFIKRD